MISAIGQEITHATKNDLSVFVLSSQPHRNFFVDLRLQIETRNQSRYEQSQYFIQSEHPIVGFFSCGDESFIKIPSCFFVASIWFSWNNDRKKMLFKGSA